jgi:hypothetical protein
MRIYISLATSAREMVDVRCEQDAEPRSFVNFINNLEGTTMSEKPRPERALVKVLMTNGEQPVSVYLKRPVSQLLDFKELSDAEGFLRNKVALNLRATFEEQNHGPASPTLVPFRHQRSPTKEKKDTPHATDVKPDGPVEEKAMRRPRKPTRSPHLPRISSSRSSDRKRRMQCAI